MDFRRSAVFLSHPKSDKALRREEKFGKIRKLFGYLAVYSFVMVISTVIYLFQYNPELGLTAQLHIRFTLLVLPMLFTAMFMLFWNIEGAVTSEINKDIAILAHNLEIDGDNILFYTVADCKKRGKVRIWQLEREITDLEECRELLWSTIPLNGQCHLARLTINILKTNVRTELQNVYLSLRLFGFTEERNDLATKEFSGQQ